MTTTRVVLFGVAVILLALVFVSFLPFGSPEAPPGNSDERANGASTRLSHAVVPTENTQDQHTVSDSQGSPPPQAAPSDKASDSERKALATEMGIQHRGLLDSATKVLLSERLNTELEKVMNNLEAIDPNADQETALRTLAAVIHYQEAIRLFQRDEYLTVDGITLPHQVSGLDPMILLGAAALNGNRVSIILPVRIASGSDLYALHQAAGDAAAKRLDLITSMFNAQPADVRAQRVREMLAARAEMEEATRLRASGKLTSQELAKRMKELNPKLPPRGTVVDPVTNTLGG